MITATILVHLKTHKSRPTCSIYPNISGMSGNTGTQSLAVSMRSISTGDMEKENKSDTLLSREWFYFWFSM